MIYKLDSFVSGIDMWDGHVLVTINTKLRLWNLAGVSCWDLIKLYLCGQGGVPAFWILADLYSLFSTILSTNQTTIHPVPRSWGMQWNLLHCWGWRRREWGFGGRLVQTRDKRASDAPFLLWTMHHALGALFTAEKVCTVPWMLCTSCDIALV